MTSKYHHPIIIRGLLRRFEKQCGLIGIRAVKQLFRSHQIVLHPIPLKTEKILDQQGTLVILNHPYYAEVVAAIRALPDREDVYLVITDSFYELLPNLRKYMIPVHIQHHTKFVGIKKYFNIGRLFYCPIKKTIEEAHKSNIESIAYAAQMVNQGHIVIICPEERRLHRHWLCGVGHLISQLNSDVKIINLFVSNSSRFDFIRLIPIANRLIPKFHVFFSQPVNIPSFHDAKDLTKRLEKKFNQWVSKIHPSQS
jgi:hypothetical protein